MQEKYKIQGLEVDGYGTLREKKEYEIIDTNEPDLLRDLFPYTEPPKLAFDHLIPPVYVYEDIFITDTTFRDGQQSMEPYTVEQTVTIFKYLHELAGKEGILRKTEFFLYTKRDKEAVEKCKSLGYKYPEVTGWIRAHENDVPLVKEMQIEEVGILTSISDYHIFKKLKKSSRKEAIEDYLRIVEKILEVDSIKRVRCHFEDITRADFWGVVIPFAQKLMELSKQAGKPIIIRIADTLGLGVPFPNASLPRSVPKIVYFLRTEAEVPPQSIEMHMHNDFYMGVANSVAGWLYGAGAVNASIFGTGERTGNVPLEAMLIWYIAIKGKMDGINLRVLKELKEYFQKEIKYKIPPKTPFVGDEFNLTKAGIHADGLLKDEEIYNIFDTTNLLGFPPQVSITDKSGLAGIVYWINTHFNLKGNNTITKDHPGVKKIYEEIMKEYENGRITSISNEEMYRLIEKYIPELLGK